MKWRSLLQRIFPFPILAIWGLASPLALAEAEASRIEWIVEFNNVDADIHVNQIKAWEVRVTPSSQWQRHWLDFTDFLKDIPRQEFAIRVLKVYENRRTKPYFRGRIYVKTPEKEIELVKISWPEGVRAVTPPFSLMGSFKASPP